MSKNYRKKYNHKAPSCSQIGWFILRKRWKMHPNFGVLFETLLHCKWSKLPMYSAFACLEAAKLKQGCVCVSLMFWVWWMFWVWSLTWTVSLIKVSYNSWMSGIKKNTTKCQKTNPCVGGYLVQKSLQECAANMGSKISLHVKCKIRYMKGPILQNFPKFELKLAKVLEKLGKFGQNFAQN